MTRGLTGLKRSLRRLQPYTAPAHWWADSRHDVEARAGGTIAPGLIMDMRRGRYALPMGMTPAEILAATPAAISAAMRACSFADVASFTRSSAGTYINDAGQLVQAAAGVSRFDWSSGKRRLLLEGAATNFALNSGNNGAVVGVIGAGGVMPTNVSMGTDTAGLTFEVTAKGSTDGIPWTEIRISGTNNSGAAAFPDVGITPYPAAAQGEEWSYSVYASLVSGSWPVSALAGKISVAEYTSANTFITSSEGGSKASTWTRYSHSRKFTNASAAKARGYISLRINAAETVDFTFRFGALQLEQQASATSYIPTAGATATRAADSCRLTDRAAAVLQRASSGLILQASSLRGANGRMIGGPSSSRLIGFSSSGTLVLLGNSDSVSLASVTTPLPDMGIAAGWDANGKAGSYQNGAVALPASALDTDLSAVYLGRDAAGNCATGLYDRLIAYPARPANAALQTKAVAYA